MNSSTKRVLKYIQTDNQRVNLQRFYLMLSISTLFIAGLISLVNYDFGHKILVVAFFSSGVYLVNAVSWALVGSVLDNYFAPKKITSKKTKK